MPYTIGPPGIVVAAGTSTLPLRFETDGRRFHVIGAWRHRLFCRHGFTSAYDVFYLCVRVQRRPEDTLPDGKVGLRSTDGQAATRWHGRTLVSA